VLVFGAKRKDSSLEKLRKDGYAITREWPSAYAEQRILLWPNVLKPADVLEQREIFRAALGDVFRSGGWTVYLDEIQYISEYLKLAPLLELLWQQGRSLGITVVGGTQRPKRIPLVAYDQASHLFIWRDTDDVNLKRLSEISGAVDAKQIRGIVRHLPKHRVLYVDTRHGRLATTQVENVKN
jgi:hypothetical protein